MNLREIELQDKVQSLQQKLSCIDIPQINGFKVNSKIQKSVKEYVGELKETEDDDISEKSQPGPQTRNKDKGNSSNNSARSNPVIAPKVIPAKKLQILEQPVEQIRRMLSLPLNEVRTPLRFTQPIQFD